MGSNVVVKLTGNIDYDRYLIHHETGHSDQISKIGMARFYVRTLFEYAKYGLGQVYGTAGTLEYAADYYAYCRLGYTGAYIRGYGPRISYKFPFSSY